MKARPLTITLVRELAVFCGLRMSDVIEWWSERAAIREYVGEADRDAAEIGAYDEAVERFSDRPPWSDE